MKHMIFALAALLFTPPAILSSAERPIAPQPANILVMVADDMGFADLGV
jgi:hypothetical protein